MMTSEHSSPRLNLFWSFGRGHIAEFMLLMVAVVWGASYGLAKTAVFFYPVLGFLAIRFTVAAVLMSPFLWRKTNQEIVETVIVGAPLGVILLAIFICETYGLSLTTASNAAFLISLCVVFTPLIEWLMLGVQPSSRNLIAVGSSIAGAWLLTSNSTLSFNSGDALILMAAFLRGLMVSSTNLLTKNRKLDASALTVVQTAVVGVGCLCIAFLMPPHHLPALPRNPAFWFSTGFLVIFCTLLAFFAQNYALQRISPTRVSLLMGSEPVFGAIFAVLFLRESLSISAWIGGALIVLSSLWAIQKKK